MRKSIKIDWSQSIKKDIKKDKTVVIISGLEPPYEHLNGTHEIKSITRAPSRDQPPLKAGNLPLFV